MRLRSFGHHDFYLRSPPQYYHQGELRRLLNWSVFTSLSADIFDKPFLLWHTYTTAYPKHWEEAGKAIWFCRQGCELWKRYAQSLNDPPPSLFSSLRARSWLMHLFLSKTSNKWTEISCEYHAFAESCSWSEHPRCGLDDPHVTRPMHICCFLVTACQGGPGAARPLGNGRASHRGESPHGRGPVAASGASAVPGWNKTTSPIWGPCTPANDRSGEV